VTYVELLVVSDYTVFEDQKALTSTNDVNIVYERMTIYFTHLISGVNLRFLNTLKNDPDLRINIGEKRIDVIDSRAENWTIDLIDTGQESMTGGRILRLKDHLEDDFFLTYGDGLSDVNLEQLINHHKKEGKLATVTAVRPPARFGSLEVENGRVKKFGEKVAQEAGWINGGFFCFKKEILKYLENDQTVLERAPLENLALENQLSAFVHEGFWQPMDTMRDKLILESIWQQGDAPWKR
jgi:glucose-1-phosphate cytidylyltransferase